MTQVISFEDYLPSPRYDSLPWTEVRIGEALTVDGTYTLIDTIAISPLDSDPSLPSYRNFTTSNADDAADLWYQLTFYDAAGAFAQPTFPVQNTAEDRPIYASVSELATLLKVSASTRGSALRRVLETSSFEIDSEIGTADILGGTVPYGSPPALVSEVCLERAVEHWQQEQSPFGIIGMGDLGMMYTARDSWNRHALKLAPLKGSWALPDVGSIMDALAAQLQDELCGTANPLIENLQVYERMNLNPTPPAIDIYPADPFTEPLGMGTKRALMFTVRARVSTADSEGGQDLLLSMMDPDAATSVSAAVLSDTTLGTAGIQATPGDASGFGVFPAATGDVTAGSLLGCTWTVTVMT